VKEQNMSARPFKVTIRQYAVRLAAALMVATMGCSTVNGQEPAASSAPVVTADASASSSAAPISDILQTSCTTCGGGAGGGDCDWWCRPDASPWCNPGCYPDTCIGKFLWGFYECLCCKDPCYDPPKWLAVADAAFFVDNARPITQTRIRIDTARNLRHADRAEYIFARVNPPDCTVVIPSCRPLGTAKGPRVLPTSVDIDQLSLYQEAATARASFFIEVPYRQVEIDPAAHCPPGMDFCPSESGFADINLGTKSLLCDCELMQLTFQFKTYIPTGNFIKGFGTGHVSLEPALLFNLNLGGATYLQGMLAYWIPIGGEPVYQANIWHNHFSLNHILCSPCKGLQLIGTLETNLWTIYGGAYTVTDVLPNAAGEIPGASASTTIASGGPGLRLVFCDKLDIGVGSAFAYTGTRWFEDVIRTEIRWRY
jgi:hypothetical protein